MKLRYLFSVAILTSGLVVAASSPATAQCEVGSTLLDASGTCGSTPKVPEGTAGSDSDVTVTYEPICSAREEAVCTDVVICTGNVGPEGIAVTVLVNGVKDHEGCLIPGTSDTTTTADALAAFRRLKWPASDLTIQPPDGKTLVNFDTNFFTRDDSPITQRITLLGQRITIEATPVEYTWHFGDGTSLTTTKPGHAYPRLDITNNYLQTGTYRPSLDTTYGGRYRLGNGPWQDIPGTVTVSGTPQDLEAIEARPILVHP